MAETPAQATAKRKPRRTVEGVVTVANKTPKTIKVAVEYLTQHPKYGKTLRRLTKYTAHDEKGEARVGDRVQLMECRPISKTKVWRLVRVVEAAPRD
ncbi:MAG TPA: 30S ribosomal protein S17 [Phycisphaerae bacterium]|jgi:small subunit ribosomal protein S17|nr:30S ribosomal protein S17 [Phycisphaerae bacterium]HOB75752.1 30S ribosomal protein S17 [Phycisphaerae bacterium]HOJ55616.1 30S ribosomal protein S17 [Phycisphaerae bacterium]HOL27688.1 30S ribosomal protein S17 [Phycisphaerae bacterium]HPP21930.1 30S ribosomal protein S17 [Phycisphaerae bacterium]